MDGIQSGYTFGFIILGGTISTRFGDLFLGASGDACGMGKPYGTEKPFLIETSVSADAVRKRNVFQVKKR